MAKNPDEKVATLPVEKDAETVEVVATLPPSEISNVENIQQETETKAVIDGVFIVDGRLAVCDDEAQAIEIFKACFRSDPVEILPGFRNAQQGEKVLHLRAGVPYYGRFE